MRLSAASSAACDRVASASHYPAASSASSWRRRRNGTTKTATGAKKHAGPQAAGDDSETTSSTISSVSRRAALALSLASAAASGFFSAPGSSQAIVDPSSPSSSGVDPLLEGGTVTLLKVRGDGRDRLSLSEAVVLDTNRKVHAANGAPVDFPGFVRVGFDIKVVVPIEEDEEKEEGNALGGREETREEAAAAAAAAVTAATASAGETATSSPRSSAEAETTSPPPPPPPAPPAPPASSSGPSASRGYQITPEGLIYKDYAVGEGELPREGQEVVFDYTAFNEAGTRIDSSFTKGRPASARIGVGAGGGLIPGFELGLLGMRPGGRRRLIVPPALGPPIGPQTFFSAKQCEVFDVQLRAVRSCRRRQVAMFSDVVCE